VEIIPQGLDICPQGSQLLLYLVILHPSPY
jgi:hypothetical protein